MAIMRGETSRRARELMGLTDAGYTFVWRLLNRKAAEFYREELDGEIDKLVDETLLNKKMRSFFTAFDGDEDTKAAITKAIDVDGSVQWLVKNGRRSARAALNAQRGEEMFAPSEPSNAPQDMVQPQTELTPTTHPQSGTLRYDPVKDL
ncbi:hypothetical protein MMC25_003240 [Agyrium rufum]|nr:hypothetical protein [Agyrium rufum]